MEPDGTRDVQRPMRRLNWTTIGLAGGLLLLVLLVAYFASNRNPNQDKLADGTVNQTQPDKSEKLCASKQTYDFIKRDLFRRAATVRGSDQDAYNRLADYAVLRMDNPVMESEDSSTGAVNCSGSLSLDLPPGVAVVGGRRTLMSDVDYTVQQAADGSGRVVLLRNADGIVTPLATLSRTAQPPAQPTAPVETNEVAPAESGQAAQPPATAPTPEPTRSTARPSFDCAMARTRGEKAVCADSGLAALDRDMASSFGRAMSAGTPGQRALLQSTRDRFLAYRDRCPDRQCIANAYVGRMREIQDILEGRWQGRR